MYLISFMSSFIFLSSSNYQNQKHGYQDNKWHSMSALNEGKTPLLWESPKILFSSSRTKSNETTKTNTSSKPPSQPPNKVLSRWQNSASSQQKSTLFNPASITYFGPPALQFRPLLQTFSAPETQNFHTWAKTRGNQPFFSSLGLSFLLQAFFSSFFLPSHSLGSQIESCLDGFHNRSNCTSMYSLQGWSNPFNEADLLRGEVDLVEET